MWISVRFGIIVAAAAAANVVFFAVSAVAVAVSETEMISVFGLCFLVRKMLFIVDVCACVCVSLKTRLHFTNPENKSHTNAIA